MSVRSRVRDLLEATIRHGALQVRFPSNEEWVFGDARGGPSVRIEIHDEVVLRRLLEAGRIGLGETYVEGLWDVEDDRVSDFLGVLLKNKLEGGTSETGIAFARLLAQVSSRRRGQTAFTPMHYDLGNEFFSLFLDPSMTYSCGYAKGEDDTLEMMQRQKQRLILKKVGLERGGSLLDIGCGWGATIIQAVRSNSAVSALGITTSQNQHDYARHLIQEEGVGDRCRVELLDYRDVDGRFDFVVSIGMFEHVGKAHYQDFMEKIAEVLAPDGTALVHTMGLSSCGDSSIDPWLGRYIFPGAEVPHLSDIDTAARSSNLSIAHVENLRLHYAETLRHWGNRFNRNCTQIRALDPTRFSAAFMRGWRYYLHLCEAGFRYGDMQLYQCLLARNREWPFARRFHS